MIKISKDSKVYVYAPKTITGGAELLHQLVDVLNRNNIDAYILYMKGANEFDPLPKVPTEYQKYFVKTATKVEDIKNNVVVIYEGIFNKIYETQNTQSMLWWLSVDHFYVYSAPFLSSSDLFKWNFKTGLRELFFKVGRSIKHRRITKSVISVNKLKNLPALHCYQSEYAQNYLLNNGFKELLPLSDFINTDFLNIDLSLFQKEDKILYNPKKGYSFTSKIIKQAPELNWVPLINMTREELINEMRTAKVYIDFGYHPGKDRIPREAVSNGCCIITNRAGSASFFEDVPIHDEYKFDANERNIPQIISQIKYLLSHYAQANSDYNFYRKQIEREKDLFEKQVLTVFENPY